MKLASAQRKKWNLGQKIKKKKICCRFGGGAFAQNMEYLAETGDRGMLFEHKKLGTSNKVGRHIGRTWCSVDAIGIKCTINKIPHSC